MTTSCSVAFGLDQIEARAGFSLLSNWLTPPSSREDLRNGVSNARPYASYEPNFWLLDGNYKFMPEDMSMAHVGGLGDELSDSNRLLAGNEPVLRIYFGSRNENLPGITFRFSSATGDYADWIDVQYFDVDANLIRQTYYYPNAVEWSTGDPVDGVGTITVNFKRTNRSGRRVRVQAVTFSNLTWFEGDAVREATVIEECAPLSDELRAGALTLRLWSDDAQFSILNPQGDYAALRTLLPITAHETVDGSRRLIGVYYIDAWENPSEHEIEFTCTDAIGLMDHITTRGGLWESPGTAVKSLLGSLIPANIPYELDAALEDTMIIGWLPPGTLREALQQIAFAIGASVYASRQWGLRIVPFALAAEETAIATITRDKKGAAQSVTLRPQIASVEVTAHNYQPGTQVYTALNSTLDVGRYEVVFDRPLHSMSLTGATGVVSGPNYYIFDVVTAGTVTLTGKEYIDTRQVHTITDPNAGGTVQSVLRVDQATLVHPGNLDAVTQRIFDYHQQRYVQKLRLFAPEVEVGQVVTVDTLYNSQIRGLIEKMQVDLTRGMITDAEIVGVVVAP